MGKYTYLEIEDIDGNKALLRSYIEDAVEYVDNIYTDGSPEMEAYAYELGYRKWWDAPDYQLGLD